MASFTLTAAPIFPDGVVVGAYPDGAFPSGHDGPPLAGPLEEKTMTSGQVLFTALVSNNEYWAAGLVGSVWRRVNFSTDIPVTEDGGGGASAEQIAELEEAIQALPDAEALVLAESEARQAADDALQDSITATTSLGYVNHGSDDNIARPTGFQVIIWQGSVEPVNGSTNDIWVAQGAPTGGGGGGDLGNHVAQSTAVHGIVNAANLVYTNDSRLNPIIESVPKTSAYTVTASDIGKSVDVTVTSPASATITVPVNLGANGNVFEVCQLGTGVVNFVGTGGTSFTSVDDAVQLANQGAVARLRRLSAASWHLGGDLSPP